MIVWELKPNDEVGGTRVVFTTQYPHKNIGKVIWVVGKHRKGYYIIFKHSHYKVLYKIGKTKTLLAAMKYIWKNILKEYKKEPEFVLY